MHRLAWLALSLVVPLAGAGTAGAQESAPIPVSDERIVYALGLHGGGLIVPTYMVSPFLSEISGPVHSGSFGAQFIRRKGAFDVAISLDYGFYSPPDGNFLASGKEAAIDTHFVQFRSLDVLSADVSFYYTHDISRWLAVTVGGGIGLGIVIGDVFILNTSGTVCTAQNAGDPSKCYPVVNPAYYDKFGNPRPTYVDATGKTVEISGPLKPGDPALQAKFDGLQRAYAECPTKAKTGDCRDTSDHPYYHKADMIPVVPVINFVVGLRFKLHRHWNVNVTGGFRDGFIFGGGPEYVF